MEYIESMSLKNMAEQLVDKYNIYLGYIDIENIFFASIDGVKPPKASPIFISGVASKWVRQILGKIPNGQLYCIAIWESEWESLWKSKQEWLLFDCLLCVGRNNDGSLRKRDCNEWAIIVEYLGPYWRIKDDVELPSLLDSPDPLPIPMPLIDPEDEDNNY